MKRNAKSNVTTLMDIIKTKGQDAAFEHFKTLSQDEQDEVIRQMRVAIESMTDHMLELARKIVDVYTPVMQGMVNDLREIFGDEAIRK